MADKSGRFRLLGNLVLPVVLCFGYVVGQQNANLPQVKKMENAILLTVILKQDQSRSVTQLVEEARANGFYKEFPPKGIKVVSWTNAIGLGQIVTLSVPPERLREVNLTLERGAWGAYRTEVYATYDFLTAAKGMFENLKEENPKP